MSMREKGGWKLWGRELLAAAAAVSVMVAVITSDADRRSQQLLSFSFPAAPAASSTAPPVPLSRSILSLATRTRSGRAAAAARLQPCTAGVPLSQERSGVRRGSGRRIPLTGTTRHTHRVRLLLAAGTVRVSVRRERKWLVAGSRFRSPNKRDRRPSSASAFLISLSYISRIICGSRHLSAYSISRIIHKQQQQQQQNHILIRKGLV